MGILITFISLVSGIGIYIYILQSEKKQYKISGEKELKERQYESYKELRIEDPVSEELINLATSLKEYSNHQKWIKELIEVLEDEYKKNNLDIFSEEGLDLKFTDEDKSEVFKDANELFNNKGNYEDICKYLKRAPIKELCEDLENFIPNNDKEADTQKDNNKETSIKKDEFLDSLKSKVLTLVNEHWDRSSIINTLKKENEDKDNFRIWCENDVWKISYKNNKKTLSIKF